MICVSRPVTFLRAAWLSLRELLALARRLARETSATSAALSRFAVTAPCPDESVAKDPVCSAVSGSGAGAVLVTRLVPLEGGGARKVIEVDNLVVRSDQRGRRVGRRLLAATVEWSRQRRAVQVEAVVGEGAAKRFYENFGFAVADDRLVLAA